MNRNFKNPINELYFEEYKAAKEHAMRESLRQKYDDEQQVEKRLKGQISQYKSGIMKLEECNLFRPFEELTSKELQEAVKKMPSKRAHMNTFLTDCFINNVFEVKLDALVEATDDKTGQIIIKVHEICQEF